MKPGAISDRELVKLIKNNEDNEKIIQLVDENPDLLNKEIKDGSYGHTLLRYAINAKNVELAIAFLKKGSSPDLPLDSMDNFAPLQAIFYVGMKIEEVDKLLEVFHEVKANFTIRSQSLTLAHLAIAKNYISLLPRLALCGAPINTPNQDGMLPYDFAKTKYDQERSPEIFSMLHQIGAYSNEHNNSISIQYRAGAVVYTCNTGRDALYHAVRNRFFDSFAFLIKENGMGDLNVKNEGEMSCIDYIKAYYSESEKNDLIAKCPLMEKALSENNADDVLLTERIKSLLISYPKISTSPHTTSVTSHRIPDMMKTEIFKQFRHAINKSNAGTFSRTYTRLEQVAKNIPSLIDDTLDELKKELTEEEKSTYDSLYSELKRKRENRSTGSTYRV